MRGIELVLLGLGRAPARADISKAVSTRGIASVQDISYRELLRAELGADGIVNRLPGADPRPLAT